MGQFPQDWVLGQEKLLVITPAYWFKQLLLSSPAHQVYSLAQLVLYIYVFVTRQAMLKPRKSVEPNRNNTWDIIACKWHEHREDLNVSCAMGNLEMKNFRRLNSARTVLTPSTNGKHPLNVPPLSVCSELEYEDDR
ncbi:hypothetical protein Q9966_013744 [Columba livia]|nr:hypothetical protein Q9966_013744 [Columba livia]